MDSLTVGIPAVSINSNIADATAGTAFAIPAKHHLLAYQLVYTGGPSAVSVAFQVSLDNTTWVTVDTSTDLNGEYVLLADVVALFCRLYHTSRTGGTKVVGSILTIGE